MKRLLSTVAAAAMLTTAAQADLARVEAGFGMWSTEPAGDITDTVTGTTLDLNNDLHLSTKTMPYAWVFVKHPIPVLPNLRLEYANIDTDGSSTETFTWGTHNFDVEFASNIKIQQYDAVLYYNILDNTFWTTLDIGLDVKMLDMEVDFREKSGVAPDSYNEKATLALPMGYLRGRVEIPATDIGVEADIKYVGFGGSNVYDARIKADYTLGFIPVVQPGVEVGYRVQKFKIDNSNVDVETDFDFSGVYGGLIVRF